MQYKVPQNVGIEDKIVGPLTLRQLIILSVGLGTSYVLFAILNRIYELNIIEYTIILIPAIIAALAALVKVNDVTFTKYLLLMTEFSIKPKKRVWDHRGILNITDPDLSQKTPEKKKPETTEVQEKAQPNLADIGKMLDSGGFEHVENINHEDIDEAHDDGLVAQAFLGNKENNADSMYLRTIDTHGDRLTVLAQLSKGTDAEKAAEAQAIAAQIDKAVKEKLGKAAQPFKSNLPGTVVPQMAEVAETPAQTATATMEAPAEPTKAKRPRNRKRKVAEPARSTGPVNTLQKQKPVEYEAIKPTREHIENLTESAQPSKAGELNFEELQKGDIEINLD